jgi:hypothetical protein
MGEFPTIKIDPAAAAAAADRARQQGMTTKEYVSQLVLRDAERTPGEKSILAYDCAEPGSDFVLDREEGESDQSYEDRSSHIAKLFP